MAPSRLRAARLISLAAAIVSALMATVAQAASSADVASSADGKQPITLLPTKFELSQDAKLGKLKRGRICVPEGSVRWRDFTPDLAQIDGHIRAAIADSALKIAAKDEDFGEEPTLHDLRLRATVRGLSISLCTSWGMAGKLLGQSGVKADGAITVDWQLYSAREQKITQSYQVETSFTKMTAEGKGELLALILQQNAKDAAAKFTTTP